MKALFNIRELVSAYINFQRAGFLMLSILLSCNKNYDPEPKPQAYVPPTSNESVLTTKTYNREGYTLIFKNTDATFALATREKMVNTFFNVYPKLATRFNTQAPGTVTFVIDPNYSGAAYAAGTTTTYSAAWMRDHPLDTDIVTHEVMHLVQSYSSGASPGWLTEGIADYARHKYGVDNAGGGWSLPDYSSSQSYTNSYRVTARFLAWLEKNVKSTVVDELNSAIRAKSYSVDTWSQITGKTVDQLWQSYSQNPAL